MPETEHLDAGEAPDDASGERAAQSTARAAGIRDMQTPTLEGVDKRRSQLWMITLALMVFLSLATIVVSYVGRFAPETDIEHATLPWMRVSLLAMTLGFCAYMVEKEIALRRLTRTLVDERVLSAALSNRLKELSALTEAGKAINSVLSLDDVLGIILSAALDLLGGSEGSVMLVDETGEVLETYCYKGEAGRYDKGDTVKIGDGIAGYVAKKKEPLLIVGKADPKRFKGLVEKDTEIFSAVSVPLISRGELLGVLNINDTVGERNFDDYDLRTLQLFAEHAAVAIANARLYEAEREHVTRLVELDKMKSEFVATVSHELRTPLTSILGAAATLRRAATKMDEESRAEFLEIIERQGNRLVRLIEDILFASRVEAGENPLRPEPVDVRETIQEVIRGVKTRAGGDRVVSELPSEPLVAMADPGALQQILFNLIDNALKYGGPDGEVSVFAGSLAGLIEIGVGDQGPGISLEDQELIFERFRQADSSSRRKAVGVGLGLYIVSNLVEGHGGEIRVESEPGQGAKFIFTLPSAVREESREQAGV